MTRTFINIALFSVIMGVIACQPQRKTRVACIGDSITEGHGLAVQSKTAYPVILQQLLGPEYTVLNSGRSATTLQQQGDFPFWICKEFSNVFAFEPDIITIKLGTNDTKPYNWNADRYKASYQALIDTLLTIVPKPEIFICYPVPVYKTNGRINDSTLVNGIIPILNQLATENHLKTINLYNGMQNQVDNFPDGIHPNKVAMEMIAKIVAENINTTSTK